jgi:hypothetical protein
VTREVESFWILYAVLGQNQAWLARKSLKVIGLLGFLMPWTPNLGLAGVKRPGEAGWMGRAKKSSKIIY